MSFLGAGYHWHANGISNPEVLSACVYEDAKWLQRRFYHGVRSRQSVLSGFSFQDLRR
jgi:hypothetical protein